LITRDDWVHMTARTRESYERLMAEALSLVSHMPRAASFIHLPDPPAQPAPEGPKTVQPGGC
jgi:hypothetical protein